MAQKPPPIVIGITVNIQNHGLAHFIQLITASIRYAKKYPGKKYETFLPIIFKKLITILYLLNKI